MEEFFAKIVRGELPEAPITKPLGWKFLEFDAAQLIRIGAEFLELPAPFGAGVAEALDVDATREPPFDRCLDKFRSKECE
jgi:hypothetical protein